MIPRADNFHGSALAGGNLDAHKPCFLQFSYMHGYCTIGKAKCFGEIIHAEGVVFIDHFHNFHAHRCAQCLKDIFGFTDGTKVQHKTFCPLSPDIHLTCIANIIVNTKTKVKDWKAVIVFAKGQWQNDSLYGKEKKVYSVQIFH